MDVGTHRVHIVGLTKLGCTNIHMYIVKES